MPDDMKQYAGFGGPGLWGLSRHRQRASLPKLRGPYHPGFSDASPPLAHNLQVSTTVCFATSAVCLCSPSILFSIFALDLGMEVGCAGLAVHGRMPNSKEVAWWSCQVVRHQVWGETRCRSLLLFSLLRLAYASGASSRNS